MTTPRPVYIAADDLKAGPNTPAQHMEWDEKARIRQAAGRARILHPGIVGEVLAAELLSWEEMGFRLGNGGRMHRLVEYLMATPAPAPKPHIRATVRPSYAAQPGTG